ncbi:MAG: ABC transporter ATP-binding protein [Clostridia bacterium]
MEILNIKNLTFKYPLCELNALSNVSISVNEGDFVLLCGASGSGKTTLLRLLKDEIAPIGEKTGDVIYKENIRVGIVNQNPENQIVSDTVWHNLSFGLENMNKQKDEIRQKVAEISEFFNISHLFRKNTFELSGGEKQLLNLASVMVTDPDILILDEPTSQLDPIASRNFIDMIKRLNSEMNLTIIISEHTTEELWNYADKICVLDKGVITHTGTGYEVGKSIQSDYVQLPTAVRLYNKLNTGGKCPLTVGECRKYLSDNFKNKIDYIESKKSDGKTAITFKDVYFRYEKNSPDIFRKLNLECNFGEITTLLGGNGSGKTTLLSLISEINNPYMGKIEKYGKKVAVLPQNVKTVFTKDVLRDDLSLITKNFQSISKELAIEHLLDRNPYDLSGGEVQRAALAKILMLEPDILCLDEPTKGIDAAGKKCIQKILKNLADRGVAVIIVSHDADFSAEISNKCLILFDGQIASQGTPQQVFSLNKFYTTYASVVSRHMYKNAVTICDVVTLCERNGRL